MPGQVGRPVVITLVATPRTTVILTYRQAIELVEALRAASARGRANPGRKGAGYF